MSERTQFVGIDLHKAEAVIAVLPAGGGCCESVVRLPNEEAPLRRFFKFLDLRTLKRPGQNWSGPFWRWLRSLTFEREDRFVFEGHLGLLEVKQILLEETDREVERIAQTGRYRKPVGMLRCFRGIDTLTAMTLLAELIDVRRFAGPRALADYVGLAVSEYSSGPRSRRGGITKAGNGHVRRILIEAAWHYRHRPARNVQLKKRQEGQDPAVIAHAWRAQRRLHRRYHRLTQRMPTQQAVPAVARELVGFLWAVLQDDPRYLRGKAA